MKKINYIKSIEYLMIFVLSILLMTTTYKFNKKEKILINRNTSLMVLNSILRDNVFLQYEISDTKLNNERYVYNLANDTISMDKIFNKKKLLFRIFGHCSSCNSETIVNTLQYINNKIEVKDTNNIVLIIDLNNINELNTFKHSNNIKFPLYYTKDNLIPFEKDQRGFYLSTVSSQNTLDNVFIPVTNDDYYTERYLEYILPNL